MPGRDDLVSNQRLVARRGQVIPTSQLRGGGVGGWRFYRTSHELGVGWGSVWDLSVSLGYIRFERVWVFTDGDHSSGVRSHMDPPAKIHPPKLYLLPHPFRSVSFKPLRQPHQNRQVSMHLRSNSYTSRRQTSLPCHDRLSTCSSLWSIVFRATSNIKI